MAATKIVDYYNDTSRQTFYKISKNYATPNYVKTASVETSDNINGLPVAYFADIAKLKFPCHTKSATWLSAAYAVENYDSYSKKERDLILGNVIKRAKDFGIEQDVASIFVKKAATVSHNDNPVYALVTKDDAKFFPTNTSAAVVKSASTLLKNRHRFTFDMRKQASRNLLAAADAKGAPLTFEDRENLTKSAGFGMSTCADIRKGIMERVYMVKHSNAKQSCQNLAKLSLAIGDKDLTIPMLNKLASAIESYDVLHGLTKRYDHIKTPEDICFAMSIEKMSSAVDGQVELKDGTIVTTDEIMNIDPNDLKMVMGDSVANAFAPGGQYDPEEIALIAPSLPLDEANLLLSLIKQ